MNTDIFANSSTFHTQSEWEALDMASVPGEEEEEPPATTTEEQEPLPEGWEETTTFGGQTVYVNRAERLSQSERPRAA